VAERTRPEYRNPDGEYRSVAMTAEDVGMVRTLLATDGPVCYGAGAHPLPSAENRFGVQAAMMMAVYPHADQPYAFGLHQCSHARVWTPQEERLLHEIGRRLADALNTLLMFRNVRESERKLDGSRAELAASRARIVTAADQTRRQIERDLHDGVQQRLVSLGLELRTAEASVPSELPALREQMSHIMTSLTGVSDDLRELSRGIHPAILSRGGLGPALNTLARRSTVPVELHLGVNGRRLPDSVEVAAYYVVAEALTNTAKHAQASEVNVSADTDGANLRLSIRDDGIGGADLTRGSGLVGVHDRVEALGGRVQVSSVAGSGTSLVVTIPVETQ